MYSIEDIGGIIRGVRMATRRFKIKAFLINCIYLAYLYHKKDTSMYMNRYVLNFSIAPISIYNNTAVLVKNGLIEKVSSGVYLFTTLGIDICNYIDKQKEENSSIKN